MKRLFVIFLLFPIIGICQINPILYFLPGQGSDYRIFDSIQISKQYSKKYISYDIPPKGANMKDFANTIISQIDTTKPIILLGVSLGGMLSVEISEIIKVQQFIIISSAKNSIELPFRYRFQKIIPVYKIFSPRFIYCGAKIMQPLVEPDRNKNKHIFKSMLYAKNPLYLKRTIHMIITWDKKENSTEIIHIHGTNDHTIPIRNVKAHYIVEQGSHMMCLTKGREIEVIINQVIK